MTYQAIGNVPPGLSVRVLQSNRIEISGFPTTGGFFTFSIVGANAALVQASVSFNYNISAIPIPPNFSGNNSRIELFALSSIFSINQFYLQGYNGGGYATSWTLTNDFGNDLPPGLSFNETTGLLSLTGWSSSESFGGTLTATNDQGSDSATLTINVFGD